MRIAVNTYFTMVLTFKTCVRLNPFYEFNFTVYSKSFILQYLVSLSLNTYFCPDEYMQRIVDYLHCPGTMFSLSLIVGMLMLFFPSYGVYTSLALSQYIVKFLDFNDVLYVLLVNNQYRDFITTIYLNILIILSTKTQNLIGG